MKTRNTETIEHFLKYFFLKTRIFAFQTYEVELSD